MQLIFLFHSHHTSKLQTEKKCERLGVNLNAANQALLDTGTDTESFDKTSEEESYYSSVASSPSNSFHPPKSTQRSYLLSEKEDAKNHQYDLRSLDKFKTPQSNNRKSSVHFKMPSSNESKFTSPILTPPRGVLGQQKSPNLTPMFNKLSLGSDDESEAPSPPNSVASSKPGVIKAAAYSGRHSASEDGSREFPFKTFVNLDKPECTRDFDAHVVQGMKRLGWKRHGIHVRKFIQSMDMDLWTATVPADEFPEYEGRCLLIKRPAQDYIQRHPNLYHAKMKCAETKEAHEGYNLKGDLVEYLFHLLIFPEGVVLDNTHFAGEATPIVQTHFNPVMVSADHNDNNFGKDLPMMWVYWDIAFKDGGIKLGKAEIAPNKSSMFA